MSDLLNPAPHAPDPIKDRCPRCGSKSIEQRRQAVQGRGDPVCSSRNCSWPNPEPGTINLLRWRQQGGADQVLQGMRKQGIWPPVP